jgi:hypothetical protein
MERYCKGWFEAKFIKQCHSDGKLLHRFQGDKIKNQWENI